MNDKNELENTYHLLRWGLIATAAVLGLALLLGVFSGLVVAGPVATVRYVDGAGGSDAGDCSNPGAACATIQYAIDQSSASDEILVAQGTYSDAFGTNLSLTMKGGYEATGWTRDIATYETIVDGGGTWAGHLIHIQPGADLFFEGFTVQGAAPPHDGGGFGIFTATVTISATVVQSNTALAGAGIWGHGSQITLVNTVLNNNVITQSGAAVAACCNSDLVLDNVEVSDNTAQQQGGGLWVCDGTLAVTNSRFTGNRALNDQGGALYVCGDTTATIEGSTVATNTAGGGGGLAFQFGTRATVEDSVIDNNEADYGAGGIEVGDGSVLTMTGTILSNNSSDGQAGGGVTVSGNSTATLQDLTLTGNHAEGTGEWGAGGVLVGDNSNVLVENTVIMSNTVSGGAGGVRVGNAAVTLVNTLIADNAGRQAIHLNDAAITLTHVTVSGHGTWGGALIATNSSGNVLNSIIWEEDGPDLMVPPDSSATVSYTNLEDGVYTGTGNISQDPLFVDPAAGDYHLGVGSPAIDAGTPTGAPAYDLEGVPRDEAPDMGAYEWVSLGLYLPLIIK